MGHGISGLPERALFHFACKAVSPTHHTPAEGPSVRHRAPEADAEPRLMVEAVEPVELDDGRTALVCLLSSAGVKSEVSEQPPSRPSPLDHATPSKAVRSPITGLERWCGVAEECPSALRRP